MEYKTWTKSADYKVFWNDRAELGILLQTNKESTGFIGSVTRQRIKSLTAKANAVSQASIEGATDDSDTITDSKTNNDATVEQEATNDADTHNNGNTISPFDLNFCIDSSDDADDDPWLFRSNKITRLFKDYQVKLHANWSLTSNTFEDYCYRLRNQHERRSDVGNCCM